MSTPSKQKHDGGAAAAAPEEMEQLVVRPCLEEEVGGFRGLVARHHYLKGDHSGGDTLRYVAEIGGRWVALLVWGSAAYKLKAREEWIGWEAGLREARRKLVAGNRRFCLLTRPGEAPNLASRVMGACLRRLRGDWLERFGYAPLVAESFVDPQRFQATCYKATNWTPLGLTAGSGRQARDFYENHGTPKTLWVRELAPGARATLADPGPLPVECREAVPGKLRGKPCASGATCRSLMELFASLPDPRARSGLRYPQRQLLAILALGTLCGCRDLQAIVDMGRNLSQDQLKALGGWRRRKTGCYEAPSYNAYYNLLGQMDAAAFDAALCGWLNARQGRLPRDLAIDGKVLRGTADAGGHRLELVALIENRTQRLVAQQPAKLAKDADDNDKREGELTAARRLLGSLPHLEGATVTADALLTVDDVARTIVQEKGGDYVLAVKGNQPSMERYIAGAFQASRPGAPTPLFGEAPSRRTTAASSAATSPCSPSRPPPSTSPSPKPSCGPGPSTSPGRAPLPPSVTS